MDGDSLTVPRNEVAADVSRGTTGLLGGDQGFDTVILGQGLAGTTLAWHLHWLGQRVLIIDRDEKWTSSKVAAGLITPITGKKLIRSWRFAELWPVALEFYRRVESTLDETFFHVTDMLRLFVDQAEADLFRRRLDQNQYRDIGVEDLPADVPGSINCDHGGFRMSPCGRLDVTAYLTASRRYFDRIGSVVSHDLDVPRETEITSDGIRIPSLKVSANRFVFCQGFEATSNPWFKDVEFKPAKGEVLCGHIPGLDDSRIYHRGVWLVPQGGGRFRVGSTYDWDNLNTLPTAVGRDEILATLSHLVSQPFELSDHLAGIRPIHRNQFPILGSHPLHPQVVLFNGLGSKGSLHAPYFARQLALHLTDGQPIEPVVDLNRRTKWKLPGKSETGDDQSDQFHVKRSELRPMTSHAQLAVRQAVQPGDIVVDATAGNGYDTQFLAQLVGPAGKVFAFDLQELAIHNTRRRLEDADLANVTLIQCDHGQMNERLPIELVGQVAAVMFNLGYLPGGDRQVTTQPDSTRQAILHAIQLLRPNGVMTILAYTGHDGGASEAKSVAEIVDTIAPDQIEVTTIESPPGKRPGPRMFHVKRK